MSYHIVAPRRIKQRPYGTDPALTSRPNRFHLPMALPGVVLVNKKDGTYLFADYRKLNEVSKPVHFLLPRLEDTLGIDALAQVTYSFLYP